MKVDFTAYLDLSSPPKTNVKPLDTAKYKKKKTGGTKFDYCIGAYGENSSLTDVITVKETRFDPNEYKLDGSCDKCAYLLAALYGCPLY